MDLPQVENPANRIYLGDLGSAIELKPGARLSCPKGTDQFFSPEVYRHNYAHKVDCWAVGVIMYGLLSGVFPFDTEEDVKTKKLQIDSSAGQEGEELIRWALHRDESRRCEAADAANHPFCLGGTDAPVSWKDVEQATICDFQDDDFQRVEQRASAREH